MNISDFKYAFTIIGGGWGYIHDIYLISENKVYYKRDFSCEEVEKNINSMTFTCIADLDTTKMNFETHGDTIGCDAPDITMYRLEDGTHKPIWSVGDYDNSEAVHCVRIAVNEKLHSGQ